jgi:predicted ester cyclase
VFHGVPPTGKRITVSGINVYEIVDGKIAREWEEMDALGMLQQLRVL